MIGLRVAKYKVQIKNTEGDKFINGFTSYPITEDEYAKLKIAMVKKEVLTWLHDLDGKRIMEINAKRYIKRFIPITHQQSGTRVFICSYGGRHPLINGNTDCGCEKQFKCPPFNFKENIKKKLGIDIFYNSDITENIRQDYLLSL